MIRAFSPIAATLALIATLSGCGAAGSGAAGAKPVDAQAQQAPSPKPSEAAPVTLTAAFASLNKRVIQPKCATCHSASEHQGGIDLSSYGAIIASGTIRPKYPTLSSFYTTCQNGTMPTTERLSDSEVQAISQWIKNGAPSAIPLSVSTLIPSLGSSLGNTQITITGAGFSAGLKVSVGALNCGSLVLNSTESLTCVPAAQAAGNVDVVVTALDGSAVTLKGKFSLQAPLNPAPNVSMISPSEGTSGGNTSVTITGDGFLAGATVSVGGNTCDNVTVVSPNMITCKTRPHIEVGPSAVIVVNPDFQRSSRANAFNFLLLPTYRSVFNSIIVPKCLGCHGSPGSTRYDGGVNLYDYSNGSGVSSGIIAANSIDLSKSPVSNFSRTYITSQNKSMPPGEAGVKVTSSELLVLKAWIDSSAPNN